LIILDLFYRRRTKTDEKTSAPGHTAINYIIKPVKIKAQLLLSELWTNREDAATKMHGICPF
ncbi:MAG: hypothetical protein II700_01005, partial [Firmicutes bacterium]|nr:hypothetical protein [Bacillota bacterium]